MTSTRKKWLRRAGLIVGIAGVVEVIVWGLLNYEGGPSLISIPQLSVYVVPFLAGIIVAWKWPLGGGVMLVVIASFWLAFIVYTVFSIPITQLILELLTYIAQFTLPLILPQLITGVLFIFSHEAKHDRTSK